MRHSQHFRLLHTFYDTSHKHFRTIDRESSRDTDQLQFDSQAWPASGTNVTR